MDPFLQHLKLTTADVLQVTFALRRVRKEHLKFLEDSLRDQIKTNTTLRDEWRLLGGLQVQGQPEPANFWEQLEEDVCDRTPECALVRACVTVGSVPKCSSEFALGKHWCSLLLYPTQYTLPVHATSPHCPYTRPRHTAARPVCNVCSV